MQPQTDGPPIWDEEDWCIDCAKQDACPLVYALAEGYVTLNDAIIISGCQFFEEKRRRLRVIDGDANNRPE